MYRYETHLHSAPVSRCATATIEESLRHYKDLGYDGVFVTNHFLDGNINVDPAKPYEEKINFYFSDFEKGVEIGKTLGIKVFPGVELTYKGTDILVYGLDKQWYLEHPEIMEMEIGDELHFMMEQGALIIHAHPFRESPYFCCMRLFPERVHGVEIINTCRTDRENEMARLYAEHYGLIPVAGSDNHHAAKHKKRAGVCCEEPIQDVQDFIAKVKSGKMEIFTLELE